MKNDFLGVGGVRILCGSKDFVAGLPSRFETGVSLDCFSSLLLRSVLSLTFDGVRSWIAFVFSRGNMFNDRRSWSASGFNKGLIGSSVRSRGGFVVVRRLAFQPFGLLGECSPPPGFERFGELESSTIVASLSSDSQKLLSQISVESRIELLQLSSSLGDCFVLRVLRFLELDNGVDGLSLT